MEGWHPALSLLAFDSVRAMPIRGQSYTVGRLEKLKARVRKYNNNRYYDVASNLYVTWCLAKQTAMPAF